MTMAGGGPASMNEPLTGWTLMGTERVETVPGVSQVQSTSERPSLRRQTNGYTRTSTNFSGSILSSCELATGNRTC
jgi:hypothetical protein